MTTAPPSSPGSGRARPTAEPTGSISRAPRHPATRRRWRRTGATTSAPLASYSDGHGPNKTAAQVSARVGDPPPVNSPPVFPSGGGRAARGGGERRGRHGSRAPRGGHRPERRRLRGQRPARLLTRAGRTRLRSPSTAAAGNCGWRRACSSTTRASGATASPWKSPTAGTRTATTTWTAVDDSQHVTITVTNVNEAPVVTGDSDGASYRRELEFRGHGQRTPAADPERDTLRWSVSDPANFWISEPGPTLLPHTAELRRSAGTTSYTVDRHRHRRRRQTPPSQARLPVTDHGRRTRRKPGDGHDRAAPRLGGRHDTVQRRAGPTTTAASAATTWQWERSLQRQDRAGKPSRGRHVETPTPRYLRTTWTGTCGLTVTYEDDAGQRQARPPPRCRGGLKTRLTGTHMANTAPSVYAEATATCSASVGQGTAAGRNVGAPVRATDSRIQSDVLTYSLERDGWRTMTSTSDPATGQILHQGRPGL